MELNYKKRFVNRQTSGGQTTLKCVPFLDATSMNSLYRIFVSLLTVAAMGQPVMAVTDGICETRPACVTGQGYRTIVGVEPVIVEHPIGTVPRLPFSVWVTYSDGYAEFRQVRWDNSSSTTEERQASFTDNSPGETYRIRGFISGDDTTPDGYPIYANVTVTDSMQAIPPSVPSARPLPLNKVRITGDNRLTSNRDLAIKTIAGWDVAQQLYNYRDTYGLPTDGYPVADGWDSPTTKLKGHGSGHYMSALALAYAVCTDDTVKARLRENITRMVDELRQCQERTFVWHEELGRYWEARDFAPEDTLRVMNGTWDDFDRYKTQYKEYGYGYLNAIPAHHAALIEMYRPYNNSSWVWAPYYSIHKQLAGLIDIATYVDDPRVADKALLIAKDMGLWVWNRLHYRTFVDDDGTQQERRARPGNRYEMWNMYIAGEVGGMSESLARLSMMVDEPDDSMRLAEAAGYFDSPAFYDPLARNIDAVRTRHANQHIPMIVGALKTYSAKKEPRYYCIAENFWEMIQGRYRYATGGVGNGEMFRQPYTQMLSMATNVTTDNESNLYPSPNLNETCCAYNLAKLTKDLNCYNPDDARYMDYYERVLYNQIVGSLHPSHYMTTYQYAVGLNASKPWGNETPQSTCCGGTGSENHVKYQEAAYFVSDTSVWVALYMPTEARWDSKRVTIRQDCRWPAEHSVIRITEGKARFAMKLRVPYWATGGFSVTLNGKPVAAVFQPGTYVTIPAREWTSADVVEVCMPFTVHIDYAPDKMETAATGKNETKTAFEPMWAGALMYGPLVMAATGIETWEEATVKMSSDLRDILPAGPKDGVGADANLYSLSFNGMTFFPDYYVDRNATHYLRLNLLGDLSAATKRVLRARIAATAAYKAVHYTPVSFDALTKAVASAAELVEAAAVSQEAAERCMSDIDCAVDGLEAVVMNKTELAEALATVKELDTELYTNESFGRLQAEMVKSDSLLLAETSQAELDYQTYYLGLLAGELVFAAEVDKTALGELLQLAASRKAAQEAWLALPVKVPEYAPWAPHGYARMVEQYHLAQNVYNNIGMRYSREQTERAEAALKAAVNTMRPGNLAEPEDLGTLLELMEKAPKSAGLQKTAICSAIEYAEMVVKYVNDGSGTPDMIEDAEKRIRAAIE